MSITSILQKTRRDTRYVRDIVVTCVLLRGGRPEHDEAQDFRRRIHWFPIGVYRREEIKSNSLSRFHCYQDPAADWTHFAVVVDAMAHRHAADQPGWHEDVAFQVLVEEGRREGEPVDAFRVGSAPAELVAFTTNSPDAWTMMRQALEEAEVMRLRESVLRVIERAKPPFPVITNIGIASYTATTHVVWHGEKQAVCKCFRAGYDHHFATEREGLLVGEKLGIGPEVYEVGPSWIAMEYLKSHRSLGVGAAGLISRQQSLEAFAALRKLHDAGYTHFDFNPANVMVGPDGGITLIDFENVVRYRGGIPPFEHHPVFTGKQFFELADVEFGPEDDDRREMYSQRGPMATYTHSWEARVGLPFERLENPRSGDEMKRRLHMVVEATSRAPRKLASMFRNGSG